ncbi:MAG: hypothetical protein Fur002_26140 [Anaerolineales bacterium]
MSNYTLSRISYQPLAQNPLQTVTYQQVQMAVKTKGTITANPRGWLDIDFSDGTITFSGEHNSVFIQPGALSFGWSSGTNPTKLPNGSLRKTINTTTVDFDLLGKNWCSLKVSHASGPETTRVVNLDGTEIQETDSITMNVTMNIHRWPRIVAVAGAVYLVWPAVAAALTMAPALADKIAPVFGAP